MKRFVISHYTTNKGTTDYFLKYLRLNKLEYYYLKHPLPGTKKLTSQLIYFDGRKDTLVKSYPAFSFSIVSYMYNFALTASVLLLTLKKEATIIYGFGSFNVLPALCIVPFKRMKIVFWGVDYSPMRFHSSFLNRLYHLTETMSCHFANLIVQPNTRQQKARANRHGLKLSQSMIVPNGIEECMSRTYNLLNAPIAFYYLGSLSATHGVFEFVNEVYVKHKATMTLDIFGSGEQENAIAKLIVDNQLQGIVKMHGPTTHVRIVDFVKNTDKTLVGIAPYIVDKKSHIYYGDSLKIKEYLALGTPFLTHKNMLTSKKIDNHGIKYASFNDLCKNLLPNIEDAVRGLDRNVAFMNGYVWEILFSDYLIKEAAYFQK